MELTYGSVAVVSGEFLGTTGVYDADEYIFFDSLEFESETKGFESYIERDEEGVSFLKMCIVYVNEVYGNEYVLVHESQLQNVVALELEKWRRKNQEVAQAIGI
jgi:hypothetical protein